MKIIDFDKKGNVVRFYLGDDTCQDYWGDDWNDRPYEHNAGTVYDEFVKGYVDVAFPFGANVLDPESDWTYHGNSPFCKEDFKKRRTPCVIVLPVNVVEENYLDADSYSHNVGNDNIEKFYYNDPVERILQCPLATVLQNWRKEDES